MAAPSVFSKCIIVRPSILTVCAIAALFLVQCGGGDSAIFTKAPLPYSQDALAPTISADTMGFHYDKHYAGYVKKANELTKGRKYAGKSAEAVIQMTADDASEAAIFNNAAQAWNHAYFFRCLKPGGGTLPEGQLAEMIDETFGSFLDFKAVFLTAAKDQFGSGWAWLVLDDGKLAVVTGANADTPVAHGLTPLFTVDVWEHAYYLDYQNERVAYVKAVLDNLADWDFVASRLDEALPSKASQPKD
jgi:Fe-Mn family superoxide dismutase